MISPPLGSLGEVWEGPLGSFGSSQGRVACRGEILETFRGSQQATHRQPVSLDGYIGKGISMFDVHRRWLVSVG